MIDADKYEGHLMDGDFQVWSWSSKMLKVANYEEQMATAALLRDTPLLLAEVIRLRESIKRLTVKVEGMSTGYRKPIVKALKEMIE